jgi:hypothetical protein
MSSACVVRDERLRGRPPGDRLHDGRLHLEVAALAEERRIAASVRLRIVKMRRASAFAIRST